jgi:hypothetical protein
MAPERFYFFLELFHFEAWAFELIRSSFGESTFSGFLEKRRIKDDRKNYHQEKSP